MGEVAETRGAMELPFEVHGVRAVIRASEPGLFDEAVALLPPEASPCPGRRIREHFALIREEGDRYRVESPHEIDQTCRDRELALSLLEAELHLHVATHAPNRIFIHAGVAVYSGRAVVLPGPSLSGKTTLVAALVRGGAIYFSDEFALLDGDGRVYPFPRPLSFRQAGSPDLKLPVEQIGGTKGVQPAPIGVIALTSYRPGAEWRPEPRTRGRGMLGLLSNALPARSRPAQSLAVTRRAVENALILEGERGEAEIAAAALLGELEQLTGPMWPDGD